MPRGRSKFTSDLLKFNTRTSTWSVLTAAIPDWQPRANHTAVRVADEVWVVGGSNSSSVLGDVAVLDLRTQQWRMPQLK